MKDTKKKYTCYFFGISNCIENAQHYDFDYIVAPDGKMYRPHFILNDAKHSEI